MRKLLQQAMVGLWLCALVPLVGCAAQEHIGQWEGPASLVTASTKQWMFGEQQARVVESQHYRIYTTINDEDVLSLLSQVMEGAMGMYHSISPQVPITQRPLDCFIFQWRSEWDRYTQRYSGTDAKVYLQIRSGGYTILDRSVAYYIGRMGTFSVSAHEGWHQYAGRHFKGRLPPFLEEGLACMFETISWQNGLPRWNLSVNLPRAEMLRKAVDGKLLWPLEKLCAMHAGDIVGESNDRIDAFYAQSWAFARFLWEGDGGRYRPALQAWIAETANGTVWDPTHSHSRTLAPWNRGAVRPMIEHYVGMNMDQIELAYQAYMKSIAYDELALQRRSQAQ